MKRDDKAVILGGLMIILGILLATTAWWRAGVAVGILGFALAGIEPLKVNLIGGFAALLGWTGDDEGGIE